MPKEYKSFIKGISLVPNSSNLNNTKGDLEVAVFSPSVSKLYFFNGINDAVVQENLQATLTNKTLTSPVINTATADTITGIAGGPLLVQSASNQNATFQSQGNGAALIQTPGTGGLTVQTTGSGNLSVQATGNGTLTVQTQGTGNLVLNTTGAGNVLLESLTISGSNISASTDIVINQTGSSKTYFQVTGTNVARVDSDGIALLAQDAAKFYDSTSTNYVGINSSAAVTSSYTISLPSLSPASNTALFYNGTNYIWQPIAPSFKAKYSLVVGSAADVLAGLANYSSLTSAISSLTTGGTILVLSSYTGAENITMSYDNILIEGQGNQTIIGSLTFPAGINNCNVSGIKITGNVTFAATSAYNYLTNFWLSSLASVTDNGTTNYLFGIQE